MNKKLAILMIAFACCAAGQGNTVSAPKRAEAETRLIPVKHANARAVAELLNQAGLRGAGDNGLRAIVVHDTPERIEQVERIVKQLDAEQEPPAQPVTTDCQVTVYVLGGTNTQSGDAQLPPGLIPVVKQLKAVFPYQSYRLLETLSQRSRVGTGPGLKGAFPPFAGSNSNIPSEYSLTYILSSVSNQRGQGIIRINDFDFGLRSTLRVDNSTRIGNADVKTSFDVKSGQKIVIGNATVTGQEAIFLVVEAKPVE